jgi:hypothetical protein
MVIQLTDEQQKYIDSYYLLMSRLQPLTPLAGLISGSRRF